MDIAFQIIGWMFRLLYLCIVYGFKLTILLIREISKLARGK